MAGIAEDAAHEERVRCFTCRDVVCSLLVELRLDCVKQFTIENLRLFAGKDLSGARTGEAGLTNASLGALRHLQ